MRADEIHPGDVIAGKYRVRAILGRSQGLLVEAFHTEFDQRLVIKILLAGHGDEREIERFRREARVLAKLESEHVARIIDVGTEPNGSFYLARQYLEGIDLGRYVRENGPLPLVDAVLLVLQLGEALAETHGHGIIVRELSPQHVLLTSRADGGPLVKITDFGTAKLMKDAAAPTVGGELTATAMFGLSPYSSPELVRKAKNVDARTDVWSLGAIFYELLTGFPPFRGETAMLMLAITKETPTPATQIRADLPPAIDDIIGWALAKDVDVRFKNVHGFAHALGPFASNEGRVLVDRIGRITEAARRRKAGGGSLPPPSFPSARSGSSNLPGEDSVTSFHVTGPKGPAPSAPPPAMPSTPPPSLRPGAYVSQPPPSAAPNAQSPWSSPPPSTSQAPPPSAAKTSAASEAPNSRVPASVPPPSQSIPPPPPLPTGFGKAEMRGSQASVAHGAQRIAGFDRRITIGALALAAVLLPLVVILMLGRNDHAQANALPPTTVIIQSPPPVAAPPPATATPAPAPPASAIGAAAQPTAAPTASATAAATVAAATPAPTAEPEKPVSAAGGRAAPRRSGNGGRPTPAPREREPAPTPEATAAAGGDGQGTLLAIAVGGDCAFSVNGASKGTSSTLRLSLKPGTYSVTCRPSDGATKSKSVTVKSGETAMAAFKLGS